jgi:hypothetical protein
MRMAGEFAAARRSRAFPLACPFFCARALARGDLRLSAHSVLLEWF